MEALHANYSGKIKSRKKSLGKETEKNRLKKERNSSILPEKKKSLAESDKGSWFGQMPSTISAYAEDPELAKIVGASNFFTRVWPLPLAILSRRRPE